MFIYESASKQSLENFATSGSGNTQLDQFFLKPGASRTVGIVALRVHYRGRSGDNAVSKEQPCPCLCRHSGHGDFRRIHGHVWHWRPTVRWPCGHGGIRPWRMGFDQP